MFSAYVWEYMNGLLGGLVKRCGCLFALGSGAQKDAIGEALHDESCNVVSPHPLRLVVYVVDVIDFDVNAPFGDA